MADYDADRSQPARDQIAFVRHGVIRCGHREIDDDFKACLSQRGKITRLRHAARGQPVINVKKIAEVVQ